jgi:cytochrome c
MKRSIALSLIVLGVASAFAFSHAHPFGDPRRELPKGKEKLLAQANMPLEAREVLISKCADCHSAETHWPTYAKLAPGSWLMERDIIEGRKHVDFSHWQELSLDQQQALGAEIAQQGKRGHMPPLQYRLLHWGATLSPQDVRALSLLRASSESFPTAGEKSGNPMQGKQIFERRCTGCHALDKDREGPHLAGVFGRKAASVPTFRYSEALKGAGVIWNESTLERWLTDPDSIVPNNAMGVDVPKAADRRDIVAFLKRESQ